MKKNVSPVLLLARLSLLVAFGLAAVLMWTSLSEHAPAGCGAESSCEGILGSTWAWIGPVPISLIGAALYLIAFLLADKVAGRRKGWAGFFGLAALMGIFAAAVFFIGIQAFVLRRWCPWCCTTHAFAVSGSLFLILGRPRDNARASNARLHWIAPTGLACSGVTALAILAIFIPHRQAVAEMRGIAAPVVVAVITIPGNGPRTLSLRGGKFSIDLSRYPVSGPVSAKHVAVIISDFTCPYCRDTEKAFIEALDGFAPDEVALVHLPGTREKKDGPGIQRIMLSLWQEHPAIYRRLSEQIIGEKIPAEPANVRAAAAEALGGPAALDLLLEKHNVWVEAQIAQTLELMTANADSSAQVVLPQVMVGEKLITGSIRDAAELQTNIHEQFGITAQPVASSNPVSSSDPDPCAPRDFCGRIVVVFNGAGERERDYPPYEAIDANAVIKAFIRDSPVLVPSLIFSSDPLVKNSKRTALLSKTGATAIFPTSKPSFQKALSKDGYLAVLKRSFETSDLCKKIMKPGEDVSKHLQVEWVFASHSSREQDWHHKFSGLPVWPDEGTRGTNERHTTDNGPVLTSEDFQPLYTHFPNAVFQTFISTCDSANVGDMIAPKPSQSPAMNSPCFCYAGIVGHDILAPVRLDFDSVAAEHDELSMIASHLKTHSTRGVWNGAENLYQLDLSVFDYYRTSARPPAPLLHWDWVDSLFGINPKTKNPFDNIAVTSLDTANLEPQFDTSDLVKNTGTTADPLMRALSDEIDAGLNKQGAIKSISSLADGFVANQVRQQDVFFRYREELKDYFKNCLIDASETGCSNLRSVIDRAQANGHPELFNLFKKLSADITRFRDKKAYSFGSTNQRYGPLREAERIRFVRALSEVHQDWQTYGEVRDLLYAQAVIDGTMDEVEPELKKFSDGVSLFHQSFLHAYFPDLVKDTLDKRIAQTNKRVQAIVSSESGQEATNKLRMIRDQVQCLTNFPLGPAFDKKFLLPKLPKTQPRVADAEGPKSSAKARQAYLLVPGGAVK